MKDISEHQPNVVKQQSNWQQWIIGCSVAVVVLGSLGTFFAVRRDSDILIPLVRVGILGWAAPYSHTIASVSEKAALPQISVQQLKQVVDSKDPNYLLLDVRTPEEFKVSHIPEATLVSVDGLDEAAFVDKVKSMIQGRKLIAYCTSGHRSAQALVKLKHAGINGTQVTGGIKAWTQEIDPSLPRNNW